MERYAQYNQFFKRRFKIYSLTSTRLSAKKFFFFFFRTSRSELDFHHSPVPTYDKMSSTITFHVAFNRHVEKLS